MQDRREERNNNIISQINKEISLQIYIANKERLMRDKINKEREGT